MNDRLKRQFAFLKEVDGMKQVLRMNLLMDGTRRENDAEHSWHFALMAMLLSEYAAGREDINLDRVLKMALIHDIVEVYAGDTFAYDTAGNESKEAREREAADKLFGLLPDDQCIALRSLWEEFDAMDTPDSRYAAAIDRVQPFLCNTMTEGHTWKVGKVNRAQVYERMDMVRHGAPELWPFIEENIEDAVRKGWIRP